MSATIIAVQFTMIHWNTTAHILILSRAPDNLTLHNLTNCQKQLVCPSQSRMLVSVLHYTFTETQYINATTDVQYIMTLKNTTVPAETL